ncbi:GNAT family N-acetyltransferase [Halomonas sp.]|uniref:GNAT family N-acetyltransferase n=3 Tax=Halomonas sp. TaxID=1486246 RepID=UPI003F92D27E
MSSATRVTLRWAEAADQPALLALFERAFGASMAPELWAWKYPEGAKQSLLAEQNGVVVAHYGGQPRAMQGVGQALNCLQISDIMVDPKARGVLTRHGVFAQIAEHFTDQATRPNGPYDFVYGFPAPRASKLGETLGLYAPLDQLVQLSWPTTEPTRTARSVQPLPVGELAALSDDLWAHQQALAQTCLLTVRDQTWIEKRYVRHPLHDYSALVVRSRWRRRPEAALVYRVHEDAVEIMDILGKPSAYAALVSGVCQQAACLKKATAFAWVTPAVEPFLPAAAQRETLLPVNIAGPDKVAWQARFQGCGFMTAGDTDYR